MIFFNGTYYKTYEDYLCYGIQKKWYKHATWNISWKMILCDKMKIQENDVYHVLKPHFNI